MPATRDGKAWRSQFYYEDWQGIRHKKNKRGFKTKAEAEEWEAYAETDEAEEAEETEEVSEDAFKEVEE